MSKKKSKNKNQKKKVVTPVVEDEKVTKSNRKPSEPMTKKEKIFFSILGGIGFLLIIMIVLININWGGEKATIRKEYDCLTSNDHVFVYTTLDKLTTMIKNGEEFYLYIGSNNPKIFLDETSRPSNILKVEQFVYDLNSIAKDIGINTIYYLDYSTLHANGLLLLDLYGKLDEKAEDMVNLQPYVVYFKIPTNGSSTISKAVEKSFYLDFAIDYQENWFNLLTDFFKFSFEHNVLIDN